MHSNIGAGVNKWWLRGLRPHLIFSLTPSPKEDDDKYPYNNERVTNSLT